MARHRAIRPGSPLRRTLAVLAVLATTISTVGAGHAVAVPSGKASTAFASRAVGPGHPSMLAAGQRIGSGSLLASPDGFVSLRMQRDGNLLLSAGGHVLWNAGTRGSGNYAQLDRSGRLTVYTAARRELWSSRNRGSSSAAALRVGDDGKLTLRTGDGHTLWSTNTRAVELDQANYLHAGQFLTNQRGDRLIQQGDGNLVLRRAGGVVLWHARSGGHPGAFTLLQRDGNLVTYAADHRVLWFSGAAGPGARLSIGPAGTLSLRRSDGSAKWVSTAPVARPPVSATTTPRTAAGYATAILRMWGGRVTGLPGVRSDLVATSRGLTINSADSCGRTVRVDIRIVAFLYTVSSKYKILVNNIITGHGCDPARHPKGTATDIGGAWNLATGAATSFGGFWGPDNTSMDAQFATYASSILPVGSGLGQRYCAGTSSARITSGIAFFADSCNHQHVQV